MSRRIRVLRVQHNFVEPTNHAFLDELAGFPDLEVHALCPQWGIESGNLRRLPASPRADLAVARTALTRHYATTFYLEKLGEMIRRLQPDILSIHEEPWSLTMAQALVSRRAFAPRARLVFVSAQNIHKKYPYPFSAIEAATYRAASAGYGCCEGVREVVRAKGFAGPFPVMALGLNPDLYRFRPRGGDGGGRPFVFGFVGRLVQEKGVFTLLRAFALLGGDERLVLAGAGPARDALAHEAAALGVGDRVELAGPAAHDQVPRLLDGFDVVVVPSETTPGWKEQFGRVAAEAMSAGAPVIGSDSGSIPEVVGDAGLIFPEKDHRALAERMQMLIGNQALLAELSDKGRARALERFTWRSVAAQTRDLFLQVMDAAPGPL